MQSVICWHLVPGTKQQVAALSTKGVTGKGVTNLLASFSYHFLLGLKKRGSFQLSRHSGLDMLEISLSKGHLCLYEKQHKFPQR